MKRCPKCHYPNDNENKFCRECGTELIGIKNYCPYCDKLYSLGEKFCVECGTKLVVKPSHTKPKPQTSSRPKPQTSSRPKPQSQPKISTPQNKEDNIRKVSSDNFIINLKKNTDVKSKVNNNTGVYMSEEANPYSKLTDSELIKKLEIAKNRHADAIKARDASAQRYMAEIKAIEKVLSTRHEKPKSEKLKKELSSRHEKPKENTPVKTKKGTNHKNTNYKEFQRLFINSPVETDILLKEVLGYAHFPEENVFNIIIKYYGANKLKKAIKNAERRIEEKNNVIKTKHSTTIKQNKKSQKYHWKFCRSCGLKVISTNYSCPKCHGTTFYDPISEKYKEQNHKNKDSNKVKIKEEKDIKNDNRIKSKKLKNKLKDMPIY